MMECIFCEKIPDDIEIFKCDQGHISCLSCGCKYKLICYKCHRIFHGKIKNPYLLSVIPRRLEVCPHAINGCTWSFRSSADRDAHIGECRYRPYKCLGESLDVWKCDWVGLQEDFMSHLRTAHPEVTAKTMTYLTNDSIPFNTESTDASLGIIDAFNKKFVFYYLANSKTRMVYFVIFMIGRKEIAAQFLYEFEIKSPAEKYRKIKFVEPVYNDSAKFPNILMEQKCVALPYNKIRNYLHLNRISFSFIIKKKVVDIPKDVNDKLLTSTPYKVSAFNGTPRPDRSSLAFRLQIAQMGGNCLPIPSPKNVFN